MNDTNLKHLTPASLTILRFLSDDPIRDFYQREIARATKVSVGATNQILRTLAEKEILTREKRGKMFFYKYNIQNPVARQLKILFNINDLDDLIKKSEINANELHFLEAAPKAAMSRTAMLICSYSPMKKTR